MTARRAVRRTESGSPPAVTSRAGFPGPARTYANCPKNRGLDAKRAAPAERRLARPLRPPRCVTRLMSSEAKADFHLLAKPTGAICNLDCKYCFFLSKEMLYPGSRFRMADDLLETYIRQLLEIAGRPRSDRRLAGWRTHADGSRFLCALGRVRRAHRQPGQVVSYTIQTNGTTAGRRVVRVPQAAQLPRRTEHRRSARAARRLSGRQGWQGVVRRRDARLAVLNQHGVDVNILCTVHAANANHPIDVYRFFRDALKTEFIQFIPIVERVTTQMLPLANRAGANAAAIPLRCTAGRRSGDGAVRRPGAVGAVSDIRSSTSGSGATWARCSCRCSTPRSPPGWVRQPSMCIFSETCGDASRSSTTAISTRATTSSNRSICSATSKDAHGAAGRVDPAAPVRSRQARHVAPLLPRVLGALRLPRRVPEEPVHQHARRRTRAELPVRRLQSVLQPHRSADADHGRICCARAGTPTRRWRCWRALASGASSSFLQRRAALQLLGTGAHGIW